MKTYTQVDSKPVGLGVALSHLITLLWSQVKSEVILIMSTSTFNWNAFERNATKSNIKLFTNDQRDALQKKTFTRWINANLSEVNESVDDLFSDLRDGNKLISLLQIVSGESLRREKGHLRIHHRQNVQSALSFLEDQKHVKLINIRPEDIIDGNEKLTLGLIWSIIERFQLSSDDSNNNTTSLKDKLFQWAKSATELHYPKVHIKDFTSSWRDGLAFCAIINRFHPELIDFNSCLPSSAKENLEKAFRAGERLGVAKLLDADDVVNGGASPDERSMITYIATLFDQLRVDCPQRQNGK